MLPRKVLLLILTFSVTFLSFSSPVFATPPPITGTIAPTAPAGEGTGIDPNAICGIGNTDLSKFVSQFFGCGLGIIGGVALLFIIYGGFLLIISSGDPHRVQVGREYIMYSVIGLILAIFSLIVLQTIGVHILQIPGFG